MAASSSHDLTFPHAGPWPNKTANTFFSCTPVSFVTPNSTAVRSAPPADLPKPAAAGRGSPFAPLLRACRPPPLSLSWPCLAPCRDLAPLPELASPPRAGRPPGHSSARATGRGPSSPRRVPLLRSSPPRATPARSSSLPSTSSRPLPAFLDGGGGGCAEFARSRKELDACQVTLFPDSLLCHNHTLECIQIKLHYGFFQELFLCSFKT
ncbi:hypothetical protein PVAP13_5NG230410 [Panicum virgatum]|uniref:Uncharacterized protein n=1 Tax=Panicum virgatum TaxID=38727 RepID=A0A8T0RRH0_PANVG|nr:hypothetical protein PVAP13_5NG230410 [Panicum virgatum]